ncbi:hypothetical protein [Streptomyces sp. ISL-100]|uniref:hypothetical protein n=1 Tax=Streptomyces sp. ISL-100 TaxID=2819173 RepID=UPI001BE80A60|nr:hypothetical protein [Streptomyces sp. ISL-100]MBT2400172.1 hypothetical protein [Streptomyces sp. ISL-100]
MPDDASRSTRLFAGGCFWGVVAVGGLFVAGCLLLSLAVSGFFGGADGTPKKPVSAAERTRFSLERAVRDGDLTDLEIGLAADGKPWDRETDDVTVRITVTYTGGSGSPDGTDPSAHCRLFTARLPLDGNTRVALHLPGEGCVPLTSPLVP